MVNYNPNKGGKPTTLVNGYTWIYGSIQYLSVLPSSFCRLFLEGPS